MSEILELAPPTYWQHVSEKDNQADCASRGLFPSVLAQNPSWWKGPGWLCTPQSKWPSTLELTEKPVPEEEREIAPEMSMLSLTIDLPILEQISSFNKLRRVTAWILQFINNCPASKTQQPLHEGTLKTDELVSAEERWIASAQQTAYPEELNIL